MIEEKALNLKGNVKELKELMHEPILIIKNHLCDSFGIKDGLSKRNRSLNYVKARQFFVKYVTETITKKTGNQLFTQTEIGDYIDRERTTVINILTTFDSLHFSDSKFRLDWNAEVLELNELVKKETKLLALIQQAKDIIKNFDKADIIKLHKLLEENYLQVKQKSYPLEDKLLEESVDSTSC